jgi:hypothetical protein
MRALQVGCLLLMVFAVSCRRGGEAPRPAPATVDTLTSAAQGAAAITEDNLQRYIVYMKEMAPTTAKWMQSRRALTDTGHMKEMQAASEAALSKAGISMPVMQTLSMITGGFCGQWTVSKDAQEALSAIAQRKAEGSPGLGDAELVGVHEQTVADYKKVRAELADKYGEAAVALLEKYAPQLTEAILGPLNAAKPAATP